MNRGAARITASPMMIGALTVIIVVLTVFLAYNANSGLPFTPTYKISVQVPNANSLVPGNEVRIGGVRVGQVEAIEPVEQDDGTATAKLDLRLDHEVEPLPADSTVIVRSRSALGLKYLEIRPGDSDRRLRSPARSCRSPRPRPEPVELDEVLDIFDAPTRARDPDQPARVRQHASPAAAAISTRRSESCGRWSSGCCRSPRLARRAETRFDRFFPALAQAAAEVAPVAPEQADMFVALDDTFAALAERRPARSSRRRSRESAADRGRR